jgi:hypothetical protein
MDKIDKIVGFLVFVMIASTTVVSAMLPVEEESQEHLRTVPWDYEDYNDPCLKCHPHEYYPDDYYKEDLRGKLKKPGYTEDDAWFLPPCDRVIEKQ